MAKTSVEFCVISARGLGHRSSLLKPQWFSVAWINPNSKYCTKVDASGSSDPSWGMKFSVSVDEHDLNSLQRMALMVEVYRREPIFLREHLQGVAVVKMEEYLDKFVHGEEQHRLIEETASFQLRRKKSDKAHGFVDISIRISILLDVMILWCSNGCSPSSNHSTCAAFHSSCRPQGAPTTKACITVTSTALPSSPSAQLQPGAAFCTRRFISPFISSNPSKFPSQHHELFKIRS